MTGTTSMRQARTTTQNRREKDIPDDCEVGLCSPKVHTAEAPEGHNCSAPAPIEDSSEMTLNITTLSRAEGAAMIPNSTANGHSSPATFNEKVARREPKLAPKPGVG